MEAKLFGGHLDPLFLGYDVGMTDLEGTEESPSNVLCKACGLCCTGHLFSWTKLKSVELDSMETLGVGVIRSIPSQRGFNQPCPLWQGQCTIYSSPSYPYFCRTYKCKLLKKLLDGTTSLADALGMIKRAKEMIQNVEMLLPDSPNRNFRERLTAQLEELEDQKPADGQEELEFRRRANNLLALYEDVFGVNDLVLTSPAT